MGQGSSPNLIKNDTIRDPQTGKPLVTIESVPDNVIKQVKDRLKPEIIDNSDNESDNEDTFYQSMFNEQNTKLNQKFLEEARAQKQQEAETSQIKNRTGRSDSETSNISS